MGKKNIIYNVIKNTFSIVNQYKDNEKYKLITLLGFKIKIKVKNNKKASNPLTSDIEDLK